MSLSRVEERLKRAQELNEEKRRERRRLFTGRKDLLGIIEAKLAAPPDRPRGVLVFWGVAGSGKSWLLEQARDTLCQELPHARLEFRHGPFSAHDALWQLRGQFARYGLSFPSFDLVWNEFAERTARPRAPETLFGLRDEFLEKAEKVEAIPFIGEIARLPKLALLGKEVARGLERRLGKGWAHRLNRMEVHELMGLMPGVFADDLEAALEAKEPSTVVIFLDTYEALQARGDTFVRELAANAPSVLFLIGGLDRVDWAGPEAQHRVRDFGRGEAMEALARRGVTDEGMRELIYEVTRGHPQYLALAAAWVCKAQEEGRAVTEDDLRRVALEEKLKGRGRTLLEEFLRQLKDDERDALQAVAVPRWFEEEMLERLLSRPESAPRLFRSLVRYDALVEAEGRPPGAYRLHGVVRDLLLADLPPRLKQRWHREMVAYFAEKAPEGGFPYLVEQVYHQFILDEEKGYALFEGLFAPLLTRYYRLGECEALLDALPRRREGYKDSGIWLRVQRWQGSLWLGQGKWRDAEGALWEVAGAPEAGSWLRAAALNDLGLVYADLGRWGEAIECYKESLGIKRELGDRHGEGMTLANMGLLYEKQGQKEKAVALWREALAKLHPDSLEHKQVAEWLEAISG
ncbi:MAG: tetratricopeptide repeat protein [Anaerolineae bacterium]